MYMLHVKFTRNNKLPIGPVRSNDNIANGLTIIMNQEALHNISSTGKFSISVKRWIAWKPNDVHDQRP